VIYQEGTTEEGRELITEATPLEGVAGNYVVATNMHSRLKAAHRQFGVETGAINYTFAERQVLIKCIELGIKEIEEAWQNEKQRVEFDKKDSEQTIKSLRSVIVEQDAELKELKNGTRKTRRDKGIKRGKLGKVVRASKRRRTSSR
jgi:hypothetical protein